MILVGSRAAKTHFPDFRDPVDWDFLTTEEDLCEWVRKNRSSIVCKKVNRNKVLFRMTDQPNHEFDVVTPGNSSSLFYHLNFKKDVADPLTLFLFKKSHLFVPHNWKKTVEDYHFLKDKIGDVPDEYRKAFELRKKEVGERSKARLDMSNNDFFDKSERFVNRCYDHDAIHRATCYGDRPMFEKFKTDLSKAILSRDLWLKASHADRIRTVREEVFVIALERFVIPLDVAQEKAYLLALERISTTLTKGWFRDFAAENYQELRSPDVDFVSEFRKRITGEKKEN